MRHIKLFDSLRGLMALWVVIIHTIQSVDIYLPKSINKIVNVSYAVDIFIILSGFVIFLLLDKSKANYSAFIVRRGFRLFPVYLAVLFVSAYTIDGQIVLWGQLGSTGDYWAGRLQTMLDSSAYFIENFTAHLFLLQGFFGGYIPSSDFAFIEPAWSLSLEWQFYLIAPLIFSLIFQKKNFLLLIAISFGIASLYGQAGSGFLPDNIHFFIVGIVSYYIYKFSFEQPDTHLAILMLCISLLLRDIPLVLWSVFLCLAIYQTKPIIFIRSLLENSLFQYIGKISYPIYVVHTLVIYPVIILLAMSPFTLSSLTGKLILISLTFVLTIFISHVLHIVIEKPGMDIGKVLSNKLRKEQ